MALTTILEDDGIVAYLERRGLLKQYLKAKEQILEGIHTGNLLRQRQPKSSGVRYFRINKQRRARGYIDGEKLVVTQIDNHQN